MAETEVRRDLATWPVAVDKRLDQNAEWIGDLTRRVTKLEIVPYADMVAASKLDALADRVSALETASAKCPSAPMPPRARAMPYEGDTMTHEPPPAPLVERMAEAMLRGRHDDVPASAGVRSLYRDDARAALRVAAEELLGPVTDKERTAIAARSDALQATEDVLRCRLAAALEACR